MIARTVALLAAFLLVTPAVRPLQASAATATILCYHVVESPSDTIFSLSREAFRQQLTFLATSGYEVISLHDLVDYLEGRRESIPQHSVVITIDDGWRCTYTEFYPELKRFGFPATMFIYPKFVGMGQYALTWDQIREMAADGFDIQSHSFSHPFLTRKRQSSMGNARYSEWLQRELVESKNVIEREVGQPVRFLAYPYGDYDRRVVEETARAGYTAAVTAEFGQVQHGADRFRLRRVVIHKNTSFDEFRRLLGAQPIKVAATTPRPGSLLPHTEPVIAARIENHQSLDPASVGIAVLEQGIAPYSYNPADGTISLVVREPLTGNRQQVVIWGTDSTTGRRVEAAWSFYTRQVPRPAPPPRKVAPPPEVSTVAVAEDTEAAGTVTKPSGTLQAGSDRQQ